jgi:arginase
MKNKHITLIGAPSSAGAYGPGQEKAPQALRASGLIKLLGGHHIRVSDQGDVTGARWTVDREHPKSMNADIVARVANAVAGKVEASFHEDKKILVIGGDCSVELGVVAGCLRRSENIGLVYIDLDTDLNTPHSVEDGAFDWMGVAHLLNIEGTEKKLSSLGKRIPMLHPSQVHFFANGNMTGFEKAVIQQHAIAEIPVQEVAADPAGAAGKICNGWAKSFDHLLIHLDVDVLDYVDMPLAENYRRNQGLKFDQLMLAMEEFLKTPNWRVLTITEINPDHGENDGSTLRMFSERLAKALGEAFDAS